ncbi:MAG: hypothetical protein KA270_02410 [Saprospiraceae bacterium]|nr:hypothetical protein [Saprospiraceae bacterium]MBP6565988.1 hypothetical protein [Saprospiraceae bacterium]
MKLYVILFLGLYPFFISAQCITGNVHIFNEEKLHEFIQNFPDCDTISGNLIIGPEVAGGQTRIINLRGLENIKVIKGNLEIRSNQWLEDITPLQNVQQIYGDFIYKDNPKINKNIAFKVTTIKGSVELYISQFTSASITLPILTFVGENLSFSSFKQHGSIFPALKTIGKRLQYYTYINYCNDFNQLENVESVTLGLRQSNVVIEMFQKLHKAESFYLETESVSRITLSQKMQVEYLTLNGEIPHPIQTFTQNKKYKSLSIYNIKSTKHYKEIFGNIDSIDYLLLESKTNIDTFLFLSVKCVQNAMLYGGAIKILPKIKSVKEKLQIRGMIQPDWLERYVRRDDFIPHVSINGLINTRLVGAPMLFCDIFGIEYNSSLRDIKNFDFKHIRTGLIEIIDNKIDSIHFNVNHIDLTKTQFVIKENGNLSYCPKELACSLYKNQTLFEKRKYDFIFSGNRPTCNDLYLKNECEK